MSVSVVHERLSHLSFPDAQVEHVELDLPAKRLTLRIDGAWLDIEGIGSIGAGDLVVTEDAGSWMEIVASGVQTRGTYTPRRALP